MPGGADMQVAVAAKRSDGDSGAAVLSQLRSDVPAVLRVAAKQLREKSIKTRIGAFVVLRELVLVVPSAVSTDPSLLVPAIVSALNVRRSTCCSLVTRCCKLLRVLPSGLIADLDLCHAAMRRPALLIVPFLTGKFGEGALTLLEPTHMLCIDRLYAGDSSLSHVRVTEPSLHAHVFTLCGAGQQQQRQQPEDAGAAVPAHRAGHSRVRRLPAVAASSCAAGAGGGRGAILQGGLLFTA
jgi:hypothetical protein